MIRIVYLFIESLAQRVAEHLIEKEAQRTLLLAVEIQKDRGGDYLVSNSLEEEGVEIGEKGEAGLGSQFINDVALRDDSLCCKFFIHFSTWWGISCYFQL